MIDHTLGLVRFAQPAFRERLITALALTATALSRARRPYVAFSCGKDSTVVGALVEACRDGIEFAWSDDELEYPESVAFIEQLLPVAHGQLTITLGWAEHAGWFRPWRRRPAWREPFPGALRIGMDMDTWMAGHGYDLVLLGLRAEENRRRRDWLRQVGPYYQVKHGVPWRCCPIWDWSADDVWALIAGWQLPYNAAYDRLEAIGVPRASQRVGPLPLTPRRYLAEGWPELLDRLEQRYRRRWSE